MTDTNNSTLSIVQYNPVTGIGEPIFVQMPIICNGNQMILAVPPHPVVVPNPFYTQSAESASDETETIDVEGVDGDEAGVSGLVLQSPMVKESLSREVSVDDLQHGGSSSSTSQSGEKSDSDENDKGGNHSVNQARLCEMEAEEQLRNYKKCFPTRKYESYDEDTRKQPSYKLRRVRNNDAVKKCREKKKIEAELQMKEMTMLKEENAQLKVKLEEMARKLESITQIRSFCGECGAETINQVIKEEIE